MVNVMYIPPRSSSVATHADLLAAQPVTSLHASAEVGLGSESNGQSPGTEHEHTTIVPATRLPAVNQNLKSSAALNPSTCTECEPWIVTDLHSGEAEEVETEEVEAEEVQVKAPLKGKTPPDHPSPPYITTTQTTTTISKKKQSQNDQIFLKWWTLEFSLKSLVRSVRFVGFITLRKISKNIQMKLLIPSSFSITRSNEN